MSNIEQLYDLQILDSQISDLDKYLSDIKHQLSDESAISSAKSEVDKIKTYQDNLTLKHRSIENVLDDLQGRLKQLDSKLYSCLLYTSPSPRDATLSRMPSSA